MPKSRRLSRASDKRADVQLQENIESTEQPEPHADTHSQTGNDTVTPSSIGAASVETINNHTQSENPHSDSASNTDLNNHKNSSNPHTDSQTRQGGATANRPSTPDNYEFYFDTDLNKPIWYNGTDWVDSTGTIV